MCLFAQNRHTEISPYTIHHSLENPNKSQPKMSNMSTNSICIKCKFFFPSGRYTGNKFMCRDCRVIPCSRCSESCPNPPNYTGPYDAFVCKACLSAACTQCNAESRMPAGYTGTLDTFVCYECRTVQCSGCSKKGPRPRGYRGEASEFKCRACMAASTTMLDCARCAKSSHAPASFDLDYADRFLCRSCNSGTRNFKQNDYYKCRQCHTDLESGGPLCRACCHPDTDDRYIRV